MPEYDIAKELAKLHTLSGAAYSQQVERIARKGLFHPVEGEQNIFSAIRPKDHHRKSFCLKSFGRIDWTKQSGADQSHNHIQSQQACS